MSIHACVLNWDDLNGILRMFDCPETVEHQFNIDISCGDGLFLPDLKNNPRSFREYDGYFDYSLIRRRSDREEIRAPYRLKFECNDDHQRLHCVRKEESQCQQEGLETKR